MAILKVKELYGSQLLINSSHVMWVTNENNRAVLWFGPADVDSIRLEESFDVIDMMLAASESVVEWRDGKPFQKGPFY